MSSLSVLGGDRCAQNGTTGGNGGSFSNTLSKLRKSRIQSKFSGTTPTLPASGTTI